MCTYVHLTIPSHKSLPQAMTKYYAPEHGVGNAFNGKMKVVAVVVVVVAVAAHLPPARCAIVQLYLYVCMCVCVCAYDCCSF